MTHARLVRPSLPLAAALAVALAGAAAESLAATAPAPGNAFYGETLAVYDPSSNERDHFASDTRIGGTSTLGMHIGSTTALTRTRLDAEGFTGVDYGRLRTWATVSGSLDTVDDDVRQTSAHMFAGGSVHDEFVVTCPSCQDGTVGSFTARVRIDGDLSAAGALTGPSPTATLTTGAGWLYSAQLSAQGHDTPDATSRVAGQRTLWQPSGEAPTDQITGSGLGWQTLHVSFVFGEPIALDLGLGVDAYHFLSSWDNSGATGAADVRVDFSHSLTWEGISTLTGADGQAVTGFTALNAAGIDYARSLAAIEPVPEPGTWALMLGGLGLLGGVARRRRPDRR